MFEILAVTMIAVIIGAGIGAVSSVPVTNALLEGQIESRSSKQLQVDNSFGLDEEEAKRRVLKLSGGQQQRVAIARALSYDPDIILADERLRETLIHRKRSWISSAALQTKENA